MIVTAGRDRLALPRRHRLRRRRRALLPVQAGRDRLRRARSAVGFCSRGCAGTVCNAGEVCADFTRGLRADVAADGGVADGGAGARRVATGPSACPAARRQRRLPRRACSAASCRRCPPAVQRRRLHAGGAAASPTSAATTATPACRRRACPTPSRCLSGRCDPYGARGLCSSPCDDQQRLPADGRLRHLQRAARDQRLPAPLRRHPSCATPIRCSTARRPSQLGGLGFTITPAEPPAIHFCAPLRCSMPRSAPRRAPALPWAAAPSACATDHASSEASGQVGPLPKPLRLHVGKRLLTAGRHERSTCSS